MKVFLCFLTILISIFLTTVIGQTNLDADTQTCNRCCQGAPGPAGINGIAGHNGLPGRDGLHGLNGRDGLKGEQGGTGHSLNSVFSVYKTSNQVTDKTNEIVSFDNSYVNIGGHFDLGANRFTCKIPGIYVFSYSVYVTGADQNPDISLMKDGSIMAKARAEGAEEINIAMSTILELEIGDQLWLKFADIGEGMECSDGRCQFNGYLLLS